MPSPLQTKIENILAEVQPMLGLHGGSIELVDVSADGVVRLRFQGACVGCFAANQTLEYGLKELIMLKVEEVQDVVAVNDEPGNHPPPPPKNSLC